MYMDCNGHYIFNLINSFTNEVTFEPIIIIDVDSYYLTSDEKIKKM